MLGFLKKLQRRKSFTDQIQDIVGKAYNSGSQGERIGVVLFALLQRQLHLIGFEQGDVPVIEPYNSAKCRGYLFGLALGILECEGIPLVGDDVGDALMAAFGLVYGEGVMFDLASQTEEEIRAGHEDAVAASDWGMREVRAIYAGGTSTAAGFYLAAQGMI